MKVLALTTQKGGAGKSTLAACLAVAAAMDGKRVLVVDVDPQANLWAWSERRREPTVPLDVRRAEPSGLQSLIAKVRQEGECDLVIIDTPGLYGAVGSVAVQDADLCLVPVKPSLFDLHAMLPTVRQLQILGKAFAFVLNQCNPTTPHRTLEAAGALVAHGPLSPAMVSTRTDFLDAIALGLGVSEVGPKGKATQEIRLLWQWVMSQLKEMNNGEASDREPVAGHGRTRGHAAYA